MHDKSPVDGCHIVTKQGRIVRRRAISLIFVLLNLTNFVLGNFLGQVIVWRTNVWTVFGENALRPPSSSSSRAVELRGPKKASLSWIGGAEILIGSEDIELNRVFACRLRSRWDPL